MTITPNVKELHIYNGVCNADALRWCFSEETDERVVQAAYRLCEGTDGIPVYVRHGDAIGESYTLTVSENEIQIDAESAAGAFYALMTLKMLIRSGHGVIACCHIVDSPNMAYRGFYQDTTRGRIPTLDTLKKLVDTMAEHKMNSLQLYVEHSYDFKEYAHCKERLGYLTKAEIRELDAYCRDRFVELVPSLSTFGHLYHLLQSDAYRHLCELKDFVPASHYWKERMNHHTINPLLDESFALITSLIDQHMEAFTSDKFNICCDETFDLGKDVNRGKDRGELYIGFVKKLVSYLEAKGKTVLMWGDILLEHPDRIEDLSDKIVFCSWDYDRVPSEKRVAPLKDTIQYVCPGTNSWRGFHERVQMEEGSILGMTRLGVKYGATGILVTNWGDLGNPASIDMAMYGLILAAAAGWDHRTEASAEFKQFVSRYHYGCDEAVDILEQLSIAARHACWLSYNWGWSKYEDDSAEAFEGSMRLCEHLIDRIERAEFEDADLKREFLLAARGDSLMIEWSAHKKGYTVKSAVDFDSWIEDYKRNWLEDSKPSELDEVVRVFTSLHSGEIYR